MLQNKILLNKIPCKIILNRNRAIVQNKNLCNTAKILNGNKLQLIKEVIPEEKGPKTQRENKNYNNLKKKLMFKKQINNNLNKSQYIKSLNYAFNPHIELVNTQFSKYNNSKKYMNNYKTSRVSPNKSNFSGENLSKRKDKKESHSDLSLVNEKKKITTSKKPLNYKNKYSMLNNSKKNTSNHPKYNNFINNLNLNVSKIQSYCKGYNYRYNNRFSLKIGKMFTIINNKILCRKKTFMNIIHKNINKNALNDRNYQKLKNNKNKTNTNKNYNSNLNHNNKNKKNFFIICYNNHFKITSNNNKNNFNNKKAINYTICNINNLNINNTLNHINEKNVSNTKNNDSNANNIDYMDSIIKDKKINEEKLLNLNNENKILKAKIEENNNKYEQLLNEIKSYKDKYGKVLKLKNFGEFNIVKQEEINIIQGKKNNTGLIEFNIVKQEEINIIRGKKNNTGFVEFNIIKQENINNIPEKKNNTGFVEFNIIKQEEINIIPEKKDNNNFILNNKEEKNNTNNTTYNNINNKEEKNDTNNTNNTTYNNINNKEEKNNTTYNNNYLNIDEIRKRGKSFKNLFERKIDEDKEYLDKKFSKFYYNGIFLQMTGKLSKSTMQGNENVESDISSRTEKKDNDLNNIIISNDKECINSTNNAQISKEKSKEEEEKRKAKERLRKSRQLRNILVKKAKERKETLRNSFFNFQRAGIIAKVRQQHRRKSCITSSRNLSLFNSLLTVDEQEINDDDEKNNIDIDLLFSKEDKEKEELKNKAIKALEKIVLKKDRKKMIFMKENFQKFYIKAKLASITNILDNDKNNNKKKKKKKKKIKKNKKEEDEDENDKKNNEEENM